MMEYIIWPKISKFGLNFTERQLHTSFLFRDINRPSFDVDSDGLRLKFRLMNVVD